MLKFSLSLFTRCIFLYVLFCHLMCCFFLVYHFSKLNLPVLIGPLSAIQSFSQHLTFLTSPSHTFGSRWVSCQCAANIQRPGISNLHRQRPLRVPVNTMIRWSLRGSFLVRSEKNHVRPGQDSNQGPLYLQSNVILMDQNIPCVLMVHALDCLC